MHELTRLARPLVDQPPAPPPDLVRLRRRATRLRRRRGVATGACVAAALAGVAVGADRLFPGPPSLDVAAGDHAAAPVPTLGATGPETVVASGNVADGEQWRVVAYEVAPAEGRSERRFCTELRSSVDGPQTCFPVVDTPGAGIRWSFVERHLGRLFLVVASDPGVIAELDGIALESLPSVEGLPVRIGATILPQGGGTAWLSHSSGGGGNSIDLASDAVFGMEAPGARMPSSRPGVPGTFWERLTSDDPERDGWIAMLGEQGDVVGYLNPTDFHAPPPLPDALTGLREEAPPSPVYGADGRRVAWHAGGCVYTVDPEAECDGPPVTTLLDPLPD